MKTTFLSVIKDFSIAFYKAIERPFKPIHIPFSKKRRNIVNLKKMNNIMKKHYKQRSMMITDFENIEYFNFYSWNDNKKLAGLTYTPNKDSKKWVVVCHWFAGNKLWSLYHARPFIEMGYNVISFDFRGHGDSQKDTSTMGIKETWDFLGALQWANENIDYEELAVMGTSMGAYVVNYASLKYAEEMKQFNVKYGVSDCPYGSIDNLFLHERNVYLKFLPKMDTKRWVRKIIKRNNKYEAQFGINLYDGNVFKLLESGIKPAYPIFFSHSKNDLITPVFDTYQIVLERSWTTPNDSLCVYNYCMHTQAIRVHFKKHMNNITNFIARNNGDYKQYNNVVNKFKLNETITRQDRKSNKLS